MRIQSFLPTCLIAAALAAQDGVVYYKFDSGDAAEVVNHASGPAAAPRFAASTFPATATYTAGRTGGALRESGHVGVVGTWLHTGWTGGLQGSMTIAFALSNRAANTPTLYSPIAGQPSWSIATGGSAGTGLALTGAGTGDLVADFGVPLCSMNGWHHFAIVVDATAATATWYHDGAPVSTVPIATPADVPQQSELRVGTDYVTHCGGLYAIDEFRLLDRAATAAEIATWANSTTATALAFATNPTSSTVLDPIGTPTIGSSNFALRVSEPQATLFTLAAGFSYSSYAGNALPLDLGAWHPAAAGIDLLVAPLAASFGPIAGGEATLGLPVPNLPALAGTTMCLQAFTLDGTNALRASNGVVAAIGD
ncbi:MAG: hypothetical protein KDE27_31440 [Planctomycetes bacterium]|nr:hypothetical protein [Planctomycetota bacterium]